MQAVAGNWPPTNLSQFRAVVQDRCLLMLLNLATISVITLASSADSWNFRESICSSLFSFQIHFLARTWHAEVASIAGQLQARSFSGVFDFYMHSNQCATNTCSVRDLIVPSWANLPRLLSFTSYAIIEPLNVFDRQGSFFLQPPDPAFVTRSLNSLWLAYLNRSPLQKYPNWSLRVSWLHRSPSLHWTLDILLHRLTPLA